MTRYAQWLQASSYAASVDRRLVGALWPTAAVSGCAVSVASAMTVNVAPGQVAVPTSNNTGSVLCSSDGAPAEQVTLTAAPASGLNRIDLVICQARGNDIDGGANNDFLFTFVTGTAAASPTVPAVPPNAVALAQILVPGGSAAVTAPNITDRRSGRLGAGQVGVPAGRLYASTQTVLATTVTGQIGLQTADYLYGGMTQNGNGLVCPVAGIYRVAASLAWQVSNGVVPASQNTFLLIVKSGTSVRQFWSSTNWAAWLETSGADDIKCNAGDIFTMSGSQSTGAGAGSFALADRTFLSAHLVSTGP